LFLQGDGKIEEAYSRVEAEAYNEAHKKLVDR